MIYHNKCSEVEVFVGTSERAPVLGQAAPKAPLAISTFFDLQRRFQVS